jgi:hypothetical protein
MEDGNEISKIIAGIFVGVGFPMIGWIYFDWRAAFTIFIFIQFIFLFGSIINDKQKK